MADDLKKVLDDLDFATSRISDQTRTISLGVLALAWLFLFGGKNAPLLEISLPILLICIALAMVSMVADYLQYVVAYMLSRKVLDKVESKLVDVPQYEYNSFGFKIRIFLFWFKQLACIASLSVLGFALISAFI